MDWKKGDVPAPGLKIIGVIHGTDKDSFGGFVYKVLRVNGEVDEVISKQDMPPNKAIELPNGKTELEKWQKVRVLGNPDAACVYFHVEGEERDRVLKPDKFEEFLADYKIAHANDKPKEEKPAPPPKSDEELEKEANIKMANEMAAAGGGTKLNAIDDMPSDYIGILANGGVSTAEQVKALGIDELVKIKGIGKTRATEILKIVEVATA